MKASRGRRFPPLPSWLLCMSVAGACYAAPQENASSPAETTTLRTTVRRVVLDVVVTDSAGRPVPGLTLADFSVSEDGKPQKPISFDVHGFDGKMDYTPTKLPDQPRNTFINLPVTPERGPLYVLLYDLVNTEAADQIFVRKELVKFIENKPAGARFAIFVFSDGLHLVQGFTSDQKLLFAAIDPARSRPHVPMMFTMGVNNGQGDAKTMQDVFTSLGRYLEGLPGRKNIVWLSGDFPLSLFASNDEMASYQAKTREMLDLLARDQISIYPVSSRGVVDHVENALPQATSSGGGIQADGRQSIRDAAAAADAANAAGGTAANVANVPGSAPSSMMGAASSVGYSLIMANQSTADEVAKITGGRAFYSTNAVHLALDAATNDGTSYYTISYAPTNMNYNGKPRAIGVELDKRGFTLSYRRAYYGTNPNMQGEQAESNATAHLETAGEREPGNSLTANMEHGAPMSHQLVFAAHPHAIGGAAMGTPEQMANLTALIASSAGSQKKRTPKPLTPVKLQTYAIDYAVIARQFAGANLTGRPSIEVATVAYDADGRTISAVVNKTGEDADPGTPKQVYKMEQRIDVPAGAVWLRMAMRDMRTDRVGTLEVELPLAPEVQASAASAKPGSQP